MSVGTHSRSYEEDNEDTALGLDLSKLPPPGATKGEKPAFADEGVGDVDGDHAEAPTIIVPPAAPRHSELAVAAVDMPVSEPQRKTFGLSIGTHAPITLEVPAYIGRRPSTPRIVGSRMPKLVMVPSPSREVSSTHVEIMQTADTVVVTDLGSTNGTIVTVPGYAPRTLRQGESLVVGAKTLVDIGDGIRIIIVTIDDEAATEGNQ